jgi:hypothetical protein
MIRGMTKKDYFNEYYKQMSLKKFSVHCLYCDVYCTKRSKHWETEEHLINISEKLNLNINFLR